MEPWRENTTPFQGVQRVAFRGIIDLPMASNDEWGSAQKMLADLAESVEAARRCEGPAIAGACRTVLAASEKLHRSNERAKHALPTCKQADIDVQTCCTQASVTISAWHKGSGD